MVRDFTEATKERLSKEIDDINKSTWSPLTDAIGDMFAYAGKWIGIISLNDDMSNVESYQRRVLDMTNTTKTELQQIFDEVYTIDKEFMGTFANLNEHERTYNEKLQYLYGVIQPDFTICSAQSIKADTSAFDEKLKSVDGKINSDFKKELDWAAKQAAWESTKGTISSIFKTVVDIATLPVSMVKNIPTGNFSGIFVDTWALIDDVFAVGSNLFGLTVLGIGYGISAITGNNETKHLAINNSEAYGGVSGLTEALEADEKVNGENDVTSGIKWISQKADMLSATVGLWSDAKDFLDKPSSMINDKFGFKDKLPTLKKADMIEEYKDDYRTWLALYRRIGKEYNYTDWKNLNNAYKYLEGYMALPDGGMEAVAEHEAKTLFESTNKWFKAIGDAYDLGEDISEYLFGAA